MRRKPQAVTMVICSGTTHIQKILQTERRVPIMAQNIPELYGSLVFNDKVMRSKLPKDMYKALKENNRERYTP